MALPRYPNGVVEYWSIGVPERIQCSTTPILRQALRKLAGQTGEAA